MLSTKSYSSLASVKDKFDEGVILALIKREGYPGNKDVITLHQNKIGISLAGTYGSLSATKQAEIMKAVANQSFVTYAALIDLIYKMADDLSKEVVSSGGGGAGGGSSTGGALPANLKVIGSPVGEQEAFTDIDGVEWAREGIIELQKAGIVSGVGGGRFEPDREVTREEFVKMLVSALGISTPEAGASFSDTVSGAWYYEYVSAAASEELVNGYPDGRFGVGDSITRQDIAAILYRAVQKYGMAFQMVNDDVAFLDEAEIADYSKQAVSVLQRANIINGVGGYRFAPADNATRAMVAKLVYSIYKLR